MKLDEMKVQYDKCRDGFTEETCFALQPEKSKSKFDLSGIAIKVSLCASVLILAFVIRAIGVGKDAEQVVETSTGSQSETGTEQRGEDAEKLGSLHYVEAGATAKWTAPVLTNDIELLRDGRLLRFTATNETVIACMAGKVLAVGDDAQFGSYVRIQSEEDRETIYYGFETVAVREGDAIAAGNTLGTVKAGRSIYLKVLERGEPQDPTGYVDLSLNNE